MLGIHAEYLLSICLLVVRKPEEAVKRGLMVLSVVVTVLVAVEVEITKVKVQDSASMR